jgi:peptidoglycan/LPS O-acetylase OafA/YrhL
MPISSFLMSTTSTTDRSSLLDILRGIAVLAVMLLHTGDHGVGGGTPWYDATVWQVLRHGYLGVQLFFVISGYCILGAVISAERKPQPWRTFVGRRLYRIFPPYWASVLLAVGMGLVTVFLMKKTWFSVFPLDVWDWLLNLVLLQGPFGAPDATMVYWSLSIEVQFYAVMSLCLLFPRGMTWWLTSLSGVYLAWVIAPQVGISGTPLAYWPEFAVGIAAYLWLHPQRFRRGWPLIIGVLTLIAIGVGIAQSPSMLEAHGEFRTPYKQLFCVLCGLLLVAGSTWSVPGLQSPVGRWLAVVGTMSYSLYLTHVPVGSRVMNLAGRIIDLNGPGWLIVALASLAIQGLIGWAFFRYCEARWLNTPSSKPVVAPSLSSPIAGVTVS